MEQSSRWKLLRVVIAAIIFLLIIIGVLIANPGTAGIQIDDGDATGQLTVNRRWVVRQGDCVTMTWDWEGIRSLHINDEGRTGSGSAPFCLQSDTDTINIQVAYPNDRIEDYRLTIGVMTTAPEIWLLALLTIALLLTGLFIVMMPVLKRFQPVLTPIGRWGAILFINLLIVFGIGEVALRFYMWNYATEDDRGRYLYSLEQLRDRSQLTALPFLNYAISPLEANNLGYRNTTDTRIPAPDDVYRIVALGGSTTYGLGMHASSSYPAQLERVLHQEYGHTHIEVLNGGTPGYNTWNSIVNLAFRVLEADPDLIIVYHNVNDLGVRLTDPDCYQGNNLYRGLHARAGVLQLQGQFVSPSVLHRYIGINAGWLEDPLVLENNIEPVISCMLPDDIEVADLLTINTPAYFERNLKTIIGIAAVHDIDVMLSTWTYNRDIPEEVGSEAWKNGIAEQNEIIRQVADTQDTHFFDLAATEMSESPAYWFGDFTHQSIDGATFQAGVYAEYLVTESIIPAVDE